MSTCQRLTLVVLSVLFCLALLFLFGIGTRSPDLDVKTITILALNDPLIAPVLEAHARDWTASTRVEVLFRWIDGMDNLHEAMKENLNSPKKNDAMDGFLFASSWLGDTQTGLSNLANSINTEAFWELTAAFVKTSATFSATKVFGVPLGSQALMLYYRQDVLENYNIRVPKTSEDLAEAVEALAGHNFTFDAHPSFPICFSNEDLPSVFLSIFAPFIQTFGYSQGVFFDTQMNPLLSGKNPAFKQALSIWRDIVRFASNAGTEKTRNLFINGRCAFLIDWLDVVHPLLASPLLHNRWNVTKIPGARSVYDPKRHKLRTCKAVICPYIDHDKINYASYSGVGCWLGGVNAASSVQAQKAAYAFWVSIASQHSGADTWKGAFYPFNFRQFANESIWAGFPPVWNDFLEQLSLSLSGNSALGLRILASDRYMNVIDANLNEFDSNQQNLTETALGIERGWYAITNSIGKQTQMELYFESLNLPRTN